MKQWTIPALFVLSLGVLLITCFALFLHRGTEERERREDLPIHPISGTSSSSDSKRHLNKISISHSHPSLTSPNGDADDSATDSTTHRHNYRRRFSDAIKGVFTEILGGKNSTSTGDDHDHDRDQSKENNSSRLKRQLELGSTSQSNENDEADDVIEIAKTSSPSPTPNPTEAAVFTSTRKLYTYSTRRPFMKILKIKNANTKKPVLLTPGIRRIDEDNDQDEVSYSPDLNTSRFATSSSEEAKKSNNANQLKKRINNPIQRKFRVPVRSNGHYPSTIKKKGEVQPQPKPRDDDEDEEHEDDDNHEDDDEDEEDDDDDDDRPHSSAPQNPKNFTLEVVKVERKVVRKEDGNVPPYVKGRFNTNPKLLKKKGSAEKKPKYQQTPSNRRSYSLENSRESNSAPINSAESRRHGHKERSRERSSSELERENNGREEGDDDSTEKSVVVDLNKQVPHDDTDLTDEDLKDYNDGHSTFGSKGNFQHTIISRNVSGFLPNGETGDTESHESLRKRSGNSGSGERKIVIEKGKVTERYPGRGGDDDERENENLEVFTVPGGRRRSKEESNSNEERVSNSNNNQRGNGRGNDLTSPVIQTSLDELYRKGHPGVVPAPPVLEPETEQTHKRHPYSEPYGESADFGSPYKYNPLVDEPPLKFDPASDRYYGNPVPDSKEKLGQSNSPVPVEEQQQERDLPPQEEYYPPPQPKPPRIKSKPIIIPVDEQSQSQGTEEIEEDDRNINNRNQNRPRQDTGPGFQYGRTYNPPDPDYDQEDYGNIEQGVNTNADRADADFQAALEENFHTDDDFFEFPGEDGGRVREVRRKFNSKPDNEAVRIDDSENDYEAPVKKKKPLRQRERPVEIERDHEPSNRRNTNSESENVYETEREPPFSFGPGQSGGEGDGTRRSSRVDEEHDDAPEVYDSHFIQTLKQFDEEIKKLQEQERRKLLQSHPLPELQRTTPLNHPQSVAQSPKVVPVISGGGDRNRELGYKKQGPPLVIASPGPLQEPPHEEDYPSSPHPPPNSQLQLQSDEGLNGDSNSADEDQQEEPPTEEDEEDVGDAPVTATATISVNERKDEDSEESIPVSVRSMEEVITGFSPLFKKRSTDGLKENIEEIK